MEFECYENDQPSLREVLFKQVQEQSDLCDVTVKLGQWEKRFHWCVLVASPYFENMRRHRFLESNSGVIYMNTGTPVCLEEGTLYLYGEKCRITREKVECLLDIAEYMFVPGLKDDCVSWIRQREITHDNCLTMLRLASLYNFDLPAYEEYLKGHIPDLIQTEAMMELTEDSVENIFTDPNLSYIEASELFLFLVRWVRKRDRRKQHFHRLFNHIDFKDLEKTFIADVVLNEPLIYELENAPEIIASLQSAKSIDTLEILIFPNKSSYNKTLPCFDLTRRRWSSINVEHAKVEHFMGRQIKGIKDKDSPDVYILQGNTVTGKYTNKVVILNMDTGDTMKSTLSVLEKDINPDFGESRMCIKNGDIAVVSNQRVCQTWSPANTREVARYRTASRFMRNTLTIRIQVATLFVGKLEDDKTAMQPVLSVREEISNVCSNGTDIALLSSDSTLVYIFDQTDNSIERITLTYKGVAIDRGYKLAAAGTGFIIYNNMIFVNISRQEGPNLVSKYLVNQYCFPPKPRHFITTQYYLCENRWYKYCKRGTSQSSLSFTTHEKMVSFAEDMTTNPDGTQTDIWESMPAYDPSGSKIFQITVAKGRLTRCAIDCPHCKQKKGAFQWTRLRDDSDGSGDSDDSLNYYNWYDDEDYETPDDYF